MSRDWTPREFHCADCMILKKTGRHLYEQDFRYVFPDGTEQGISRADEEYVDRYPYITMFEMGIVEKLVENGFSDSIIKRLDEIVKDILEQDKLNSELFRFERETNVFMHLTAQWYNGLSDGAISYNHCYNDEAFIGKLKDALSKQIKKE